MYQLSDSQSGVWSSLDVASPSLCLTSHTLIIPPLKVRIATSFCPYYFHGREWIRQAAKREARTHGIKQVAKAWLVARSEKGGESRSIILKLPLSTLATCFFYLSTPSRHSSPFFHRRTGLDAAGQPARLTISLVRSTLNKLRLDVLGDCSRMDCAPSTGVVNEGNPLASLGDE